VAVHVKDVSGGFCYITVSRSSCSTGSSVAVPVRQVSGGSRDTDRSVTLPVTQTGSLAALS
jgi:hypothetical protein